MYERMCYQKLDQPVIVWLGLEFREVAVAFGVGGTVAFLAGFVLSLGLVGLLLGVGTGVVLIWFFRSLRMGGPGHVVARLYQAGLFEIVPAALRPTYLLPIPETCREGRFQLSPILEKGEHARDTDALRYFGR